MIAYKIYSGDKAKDLSISETEYTGRLYTLNCFLETWDKKTDFKTSYLNWIKQDQLKPDFRPKTLEGYEYHLLDPNAKLINNQAPSEEKCCNKLSKKEMAKGLVKSAGKIIRSKAKRVPDAEYRKRFSICTECQFLKDGRCRKCGCFMRIKSKFAAMSCPIDKW